MWSAEWENSAVLRIQTILLRIPDPVFNIPDSESDPSKLKQDFNSNKILYQNRILPC